jgi:putative transcriptional regulator
MNLAGTLLIAPPAVKNTFWHKTVIAVTEHHGQGSVGFVLNKRSSLSIFEFGKQMNCDIDLPGYVYVGGPVNSQSLTMLHSTDWRTTNTLRISNKLSLSSTGDMIHRLASGDRPEYYRIFLGMCGWAVNQLEGEIEGKPPWTKETSWCLTKSTMDLVFGSDQQDQWCDALDKSGLEFAQNILA